VTEGFKTFFMLQTQTAPTQGPNIIIQLLPYAAIIAVFYFLLIAPARRRQKETQSMLASLKNGDRIVTSGGICGTVVRVVEGEDKVRLRIATSVEIEILRSAISGVETDNPKGS